MAKAARKTFFELDGDVMRAGWGGRVAAIAFHIEESADGEVLVVETDAVECWEGGEEIALEDLNRLFVLIERECEARGVESEFE